MEFISTAIETTGIVDTERRLLLDDSLPLAKLSAVRVIILYTKEVKQQTDNQTEDYVNKLAGLHKEIWQGVNTDIYLQEEREAWK